MYPLTKYWNANFVLMGLIVFWWSEYKLIYFDRNNLHEAVVWSQLTFSGCDECVDHILGSVKEIPKLRLPDGQNPRMLHTDSIFESQHSLLG